MVKISIPEFASDLLQGLCDLHVYAGPDLYHRAFNEMDLAKEARDVGYRAMLIKSHQSPNADRAQDVRKVVPGIEVFGGIVLNWPVGGLNPDAVAATIGFGGKEIWMPNFSSANHQRFYGSAEYTKL